MRPLTLAVFLSCQADPSTQKPPPRTTTPSTPSQTDTGTEPLGPGDVAVQVLVDGKAVTATVYVGGRFDPHPTDAAGRVVLALQRDGTEVVIASHPDARTEAVEIRPSSATITVHLERFDRSDNPAYAFQDPGTPMRSDTTDQCGHCHVTINADWFDSPHRTSASNPVVQDVYAGTAAAFPDAAACAAAGGRWWTGLEPGTRASVARCYLGSGTLPDLDPTCGDTLPCDGVATATGGCADCHAPAIDGVLGGRDLLEATGLAYDYGVHCDLCHKVESLDVGAAAGVAGWLRVLRPTEPSPIGGLTYRPLQFGPYDDVPHVRMGSVARDLFYEAELCGGCHELHQTVLVPGASADAGRWPSGTLPIHTTWSEWQAGPLSPQSPCQSCHMPPDPSVGNASDLGNAIFVPPGLVGGWYRPPGAVRAHSWPGPRTRASRLLELAAAVDLQTSTEDGTLVVSATVTNTGAGHAVPTGEPLRALLLFVQASCKGVPLEATGGDVAPEWVGALDVRPAAQGWNQWPGAAVGDEIRVIARSGGYRDYVGPGRFGDGSFTPLQRGLPEETFAGRATITAVNDGAVTFDRPLPAGDVAYRVPGLPLPTDGEPTSPRAGSPGFAYAKVLVDASGQPMVPHHAAVDVVSDNRLMPLVSATTTHRFASTCAEPVARAVLVHRPLPWGLSVERGWSASDAVIAEAAQ